MNNNKFQLEKRFKWLRIGLIAGVLLIVLFLGQIIFTSTDNFHTFMNWFQFILWTTFSITNWFQFKKVKEQLQNLS